MSLHNSFYYSVIFKTSTDDLENIKSLLNDGVKNLFSGDLFKKQSILSDSDIKALESYNAEIERGVSPVTAYYRTLQNASDAAVNMAQAAYEAAGGINETTVNLSQIPEMSQAGQVALGGLKMVGNMFTEWAINEAISFAVEKLDKFVNNAKYTKARVDELMSSYKSQLDVANDKAEKVEQITDRYEELSNGVNNLGKNISLTADEYNEYNKIVNNIADMFPQLIKGYTDEGNAILTLKGNVAELRDTYTEAQQEAYNTLIASGNDSNGNDIIENFNNLDSTSFDFGDVDVGGAISYNDAIKTLNSILSMSKDDYWDARTSYRGRKYDISNGWTDISDEQKNIKNHLRFIDDNLDYSGAQTDEDFARFKKEAKALVDTYNAEVKSRLSNVQSLANAYLMTNDDYGKLDEESKSIASVFANNITYDIASNFKDKFDVDQYIIDIVNGLEDTNSNFSKAVSKLFALNLEDLPLDESEEQIDKYLEQIKAYLEQILFDMTGKKVVIEKEELRSKLGFSDTKELNDNLNATLADGTKKFGIDSEKSLSSFAKRNSINTQSEISDFKKAIESANSLQELYNSYTESRKNSKMSNVSFDKAWDSINNDTKQSLLDIASSGELTGKKLRELAKDDKLLNAAFKSTGMSAKEFAKSIRETSIDNMQDDIDGYESALKKIQNGESLTEEETAALISKNDSLAGSIKKTKDGYKIEESAILSVVNASKQKYNIVVANEILETNKVIESVKKKISAYKSELKAIKSAMAARQAEYDSIISSGEYEGKEDEVARGIFGNSQAKTDYTASLLLPDQINKKQGRLKKSEKRLKQLEKTLKELSIDSPSDTSNTKPNTTSETKQEIDWIARSIDRTTAKIDLLKAKLQNIFNVDKKKNNIDRQIKQTTKLINTYDKAVTKYTKKANSVKLDSKLKRLVRNGKVTGNYKELVKEYGEDTASKIQKYQDYYDKAQEARRNRAAQKTAKRELKQEKYQNYVDLYDTRAARAETRSGNVIRAEKQNDYLETQIKNLRLSYKYQKQIARLTGNTAEKDRLKAELKAKVAEIEKQKIDNIAKEYDNLIGEVDNHIQNLDNSISLAQARGQIITANYYQNLNNQQTTKRTKATEERKALQDQLNEGRIKKYSDDWYEVQSKIQELNNTINECDIAIAENTTAIREVHTALLEAKAQNASRINTEADFLAELLSRNELTDSDTGTFTNAGLGTLGTYGINLETAQSQIREWNKERSILESMKKSGSLDYGDGVHKYDSPNQLDDAYKAIIEKQQEWVKNEFDAEQKIIDLMKEKYQAQLDYMKEIIDAKKKALDYEKDLYDYQKNIAEKTKNIATLEKQLAALQGDNSEEGRARRTQLQLSLDEANQDLQDTEYDKYISDQQNMLDNLYAEYEDLMNKLFKNTDALLQKGIEAINNNTTLIQGILDKTAKDYGYDYSDNFSEIMGAFKQGGVVTSIKESLYNDKSSIASILNKQNEYLETKYGENNSPSQSQQNVDLAAASGDYGSNATENGYISDTGNSVANGKTYDSVDNSDVYEYNQALNDALKSMIGDGYQYLWNFSGNTPSSYVNKSLIENKIYPYKKNGKTKYAYLSKDGLQVLAEKLGVNFPAKEGNATAELKAYFEKAGFHTGGIIRATGVPSDGDYVPIRVNPNETVLTQDFTKMLPSAVDIMARFVDAQTIPNYSTLPPNISGSQSFGDVVFHAELPNVKNAQDFVDALQNDTRVQKAFTVATKDLISKGRITNNIQSVS